MNQFFDKTFWISLGTMFVALAISLATFLFGDSSFFLIIVVVFLTFLSSKDPRVGLLAVFLELFSNPHGQLLSSQISSFTFSLRMAVFIGFFIGYTIHLLRIKQFPQIRSTNLNPWLFLIIGILIGFLNGIFSNNQIDVFNDGNAYFYLLYLIPILSLTWNSKIKKQLLSVLAAGAVFNIFISFFILYFFTHVSDLMIQTIYIFFRDVRLAEITKLGESFFYRVFIQTQFFTIVFGALVLALLPKLLVWRDKVYAVLLFAFIFATLLLSLSRSFWVGMFFAITVFIIFFIRFFSKKITYKIMIGSILSSVVIGFALIILTVLFPFPAQKVGGSDLADFFVRRVAEEDASISSRWNLLNPMLKTISQNPIFGNGFGKRATFNTEDPRALSINPDGTWSTYAMEWGWFELWYKMGIFGPIGFLIIFVWIVRRLLSTIKNEQGWLSLGLITGIVFLYTIHFFSPYLNHPIGLGFLLFTMVFVQQKDTNVTQISFQSNLFFQQEKPVPSSVVYLQAEE